MEAHEPPNPSIDCQQVDRFLSLRRVHRATACYPCRQRKVKCDSAQPCKTCKRRNHPEICIYTKPEQTASIEGPATRRRVPNLSNQEIDGPLCSSIALVQQVRNNTSSPNSSVRSVFDSRQSSATSAGPDPTTKDAHPFSGDNSLPSIIRHSTESATNSLLRDIEPALGLQNTYTIYPFMDEELQQDPSTSLLKLLPQREEILT